ncbi:MAG TPA: hypothetical protein VF080_06450 [Solirubrobacteraceae bacterium]
MATTQDIHAPTLGTQGEPCASCGAPLAGDQRYCLECGARRAQARVAFRDILGPGGASPPPPAGAPAAAPDDPPARSGLTFLVGLLCLLAALGVGVLIGNSGDDKTAAAPPPAQVITVSGAAAAPATTSAGATSPPASSTPSSGAGGSSAKATKGAGSSAKSSKGSAADNKKVKDLNSSSGADYQKKSQKLPKAVGTSGAPAKKDNKPAGGGTGFQEIG